MAAPVVAGAAALLLQARPDLNPDQVKALLTANTNVVRTGLGLGTAESFAVLAGTTVTNTGPSTINGNLGLSPGTAVTGFGPGTVNGTTYAADAIALKAQSDLTIAYDDAAARTPAVSAPADLGGLTLAPGVYQQRVVARADRDAHARRPGRSERRLRLPGRLDADHRVGEPGQARQRRAGLQRVLEGRQLRHARDRHGPRRQHPGADVDLDERRRHAARPGARAQRRRDAHQRHDHRRALRDRRRRVRPGQRAGRRRRAAGRAGHRRQPGPVAEPAPSRRRSSRPASTPRAPTGPRGHGAERPGPRAPGARAPGARAPGRAAHRGVAP